MIEPTTHRPMVIGIPINVGDVVECENGHYFATCSKAGVRFGGWPEFERNGKPLEMTGAPLPIQCTCGAVAIAWDSGHRRQALAKQ